MKLYFVPSHACCAIFALVFVLGCQSDTAESLTLSDEKIARIMADLSIADAATNSLAAGFQKDSLMHLYFKQTFEIHGTTLEVYEKNLRILATDLDHMERVVKQSEEMLAVKKDEPKIKLKE